MPKVPRISNQAELQAFDDVCTRLGGFDRKVATEWVDGYMTALAAGPRAVAVDEWLPVMCGDAFDRAFADPADREQAHRVLHARQAVLTDQLDPEFLFDAPDELRLTPLMEHWDEAARAEAVAEGWVQVDGAAELTTGAVWAEGFFDAVDAFPGDWDVPKDDEDAALVGDLLAQLRALTLPEQSEALRKHISITYKGEGADRDRHVDEACFAVQDLRAWWVDHAPKPDTRRVEKTPGRNDPCPCGSGKKFKKCHGA